MYPAGSKYMLSVENIKYLYNIYVITLLKLYTISVLSLLSLYYRILSLIDYVEHMNMSRTILVYYTMQINNISTMLPLNDFKYVHSKCTQYRCYSVSLIHLIKLY